MSTSAWWSKRSRIAARGAVGTQRLQDGYRGDARTPAIRSALAALAVAGAGLALGACGDEGDVGRPGRPVTVNVGVVPIADLAPLYLGRDRGFFADEKLEVRPRVAQSGAVIVPSVVSGDFQFGWSNTTSLIIARSRGLPLRIVSRGARGGSSRSEASAEILVTKDGRIKRPTDLEGGTIGVPALQSIATLTANAALERRGVDISKVEYIEIPFPQAVSALESGRVDAVFVAEPFVTLGLEAGHRSISRPILETAPNYINAAYFTTEKYIADHPDVVARFVRAVNRSFDYAAGHPDEVRDVLPTYTEIPPTVAQVMTLPDFSRYTDTSTLDLTVDLAKKYGYIESEPDVSELLYEPQD
jgi:NitT/TauT family transport system substrate-binding protein